MPHSTNNNNEIGVASRDATDEIVDDRLPFFFCKDVSSHKNSITEV